MTYVEDLGWLTERESAWWESEDGRLSDFTSDGRERTRRIEWFPKCGSRRVDYENVQRKDPRWNPLGYYAAPGLGVPICSSMSGRVIRPKHLPWEPYE